MRGRRTNWAAQSRQDYWTKGSRTLPSVLTRKGAAAALLLCAAGVDQAERAIVRGLANRVERAAAACGRLLRAGVGASWTFNQCGDTAVGQKQRRAAAATAQYRARNNDCQHRGTAREEREAAVHVKPRSRLVFGSHDCATRQLRCVPGEGRLCQISMPCAAIFL